MNCSMLPSSPSSFCSFDTVILSCRSLQIFLLLQLVVLLVIASGSIIVVVVAGGDQGQEDEFGEKMRSVLAAVSSSL